MKMIKLLFLPAVLLFMLIGNSLHAQQKDTTAASKIMYKIVKNDGVIFVGKIISSDAREVLIETKELGQVAIPKHDIKEIKELAAGELSASGDYIPSEVFATRYFLTTNGLPIEKGDSYVQWNLFGPDLQFGVAKNFGLGIMTSWVAVPIIGTAKYTINLAEDVNLGIGGLLGTGSWAKLDFGLALPFASLTFGNRRHNLTFSGGYGAVFNKGNSEGRVLCSVAGMIKVSRKVSLVFDSFIMPPFGERTVVTMEYNPATGTYFEKTTTASQTLFALVVPGLRWQKTNTTAFQFGFLGMNLDGSWVPLPIPMVQWYTKL